VSPYQSHPELFIPSPRSIIVSGDNTSTNRVTSFSYELNINRQPIFSIDSYKDVDEVVFLPPINITASLNFDAVNFTPENYEFFIVSTEKKNFNVTINDRKSNSGIYNLNIPNIQLVSQSLDSSAENKLTISNSYIGYLE
jgi:hypothetical protein